MPKFPGARRLRTQLATLLDCFRLDEGVLLVSDASRLCRDGHPDGKGSTVRTA